MIIRRPHMVRPSPIATQPQLALDAAHVKAFGKVIIRGERCRGDGERATGRLLLAHGLPPIPFGLIQIVQAAMGTEFERAETKAECGNFRVDRGHDHPVLAAQIADGQFDGCAGAGGFQRL